MTLPAHHRFLALLAALALVSSVVVLDAAPATAAGPFGAAVGGPYSIAEGEPVVLDGSSSTGSPSSYAWDLDADGSFDDAFGSNPTVSWATLESLGLADDGLYPIALRVGEGVDADVAIDPAGLSITNTEPQVVVDGSGFAASTSPYLLNLSAVDPGADTATSFRVSWGDGTSDVYAGPAAVASHVYGVAGPSYQILVEVTDEDGTWTGNDLLVPLLDTINDIDRLDVDTATATATLGGGSGIISPYAATIGPDGLVYVTGLGSNRVARFDPSTNAFVDTFVSFGSGGLLEPKGLTFGPDGNLYVSSYLTGAILRYDGATGAFIDSFADAGILGPTGLEFGPSGDLWVADRPGGRVVRLDSATGAVIDSYTALGPSLLPTPDALTFGPDGNLYVSLLTGDSVIRLDGVTGVYIDEFVPSGSGGLNGPNGVRFGPDGRLWVSSYSGDAMLRFDGTTGAFVDTFHTWSLLGGPSHAAFAPSTQVQVGASALTVNATADRSDLDTADGFCDTGFTNSSGDPECTLRAALEQANANAGLDVVSFDIPVVDPGHSAGVWTIAPSSELPSVTETVSLNGTSQPGWVSSPIIEIDGSSAGPGSHGLRIQATDVDVRGLAINRFGGDGIEISPAGSGAVVQGNLIGVGVDGVTAAANGLRGIAVFGASDVLIGGTGPGDGNVVANHPSRGVLTDLAADRITLLGNSIHDNFDIGFDLGIDGVTVNDPGDGDVGPNGFLNHPELGSAIEVGAVATVDFSLDIPAGDYRVEFFVNPSGADPTGHGEGETLAHAETVTHPGGAQSFVASFAAAAGQIATATVTEVRGADDFGSTSEFSQFVTIRSDAVVVNATAEPGDLVPGDGVCDTGGLNSEGQTECTLRAAIEETNAHPLLDTILFDLPASDPNYSGSWWTVTPAVEQLPDVRGAVLVDATSQPGYAGTPLVVIDGTIRVGAGATTDAGISAQSNGVTISGFSVVNWPSAGIWTGASDVTIEQNYAGLLPDGTAAGNGHNGLVTYLGSSVVFRDNVSSGNTWGGLWIGDSSDVTVVGNIVGLDPSGTSPRANGRAGIDISTGNTNVTIGGPAADDGNIISGNTLDGIFVEDATSPDLRIEGNHVGTDVSGNLAIANGEEGLQLAGSGHWVVDNVIGGNTAANVHFWPQATGVVMTGNSIGVGADGTSVLGGVQHGILLSGASDGNRIGGTGPGEGNLIAHHTFEGIKIESGTGNSVLGNRIFGNGWIGIALGLDDVTANDANDADVGANDLLNFPVLVAAVETGGVVTLDMALDVPAGDYRVEFFTNPSGVNPSGSGGGESLVHVESVTHPGGGSLMSMATFAGAAGDILTATMTEDLGGGLFGSTSEFSAAVAVLGGGASLPDSSSRRTDLIAFGGLDVGSPGPGLAADGVALGGGAERLVGPATDVISGQLTLSAWVRLDTFGTDPRVVAKAASDGAAIYELLVDDATSEAVARFNVGGATVEVRGGTIAAGSWQQLASTWDGADARLYVDGVEVAAAPAVGSLATDLSVPLVVGNLGSADRGLDGSIDHVEVSHVARSAAWIATARANISNPESFLTVSAPETGVAQPWTASTTVAHSGSGSLQAPETAGGTDAWATALGLDEPGVEFESWWRVSDPSVVDVAAGTRTGADPVDQNETSLTAAGLDLATQSGGVRTQDASSPLTLAPDTWVKVVMKTDETGTSSVWIDGIEVIGATLHSGGLGSGSIGFRTGDLPIGATWFIDDVRVRRLVSAEPVATLGSLDRY